MTDAAKFSTKFASETGSKLVEQFSTIAAQAEDGDKPYTRLFVGNHSYEIHGGNMKVIVNSPDGYGASITTDSPQAAAAFIFGLESKLN